MRSVGVLLMNSLNRMKTLFLVMGVLLCGFQVLLILVARSIQRSNAFEQIATLIPDFIRQLMGPSFVGLMSFSGVVCIGYFHLAVMGALIGLAIAVATEPAAEIETRFLDLILARPIARHWIVTRSLLLLVLAILFLVAMMMLGTFAGLRTLGPSDAAWPSRALIGSLALNLGILVFCWGGVTLAVTSISRRRSVAGSITGFLALATFLLDYVARAWEPAEAVAWLSPFRYYSPLALILGDSIPQRNIWVLGGIAVAGTVMAYMSFARRDI